MNCSVPGRYLDFFHIVILVQFQSVDALIDSHCRSAHAAPASANGVIGLEVDVLMVLNDVFFNLVLLSIG